MPSYVITGVSRGLGWELLKLVSVNADSVVIGIVRNKAQTEDRVAKELAGQAANIHLVEADITNYDAIKNAANEVSVLTGGSVDYLIANAGLNMSWDGLDPIGDLVQHQTQFDEYFHAMINTNVLANIHLYGAFVPLIQEGTIKKVIHLTSAMGDAEFTKDFDLTLGSVYSAAKAAMNMMTAKFAAQYKQDGILFLGVCPGVVNTGQFDALTEEQMAKFAPMAKTWQDYAPDFKGPVSPDLAAADVLAVIHKSSVDNGDSGNTLSHHGTKKWL